MQIKEVGAGKADLLDWTQPIIRAYLDNYSHNLNDFTLQSYTATESVQNVGSGCGVDDVKGDIIPAGSRPSQNISNVFPGGLGRTRVTIKSPAWEALRHIIDGPAKRISAGGTRRVKEAEYDRGGPDNLGVDDKGRSEGRGRVESGIRGGPGIHNIIDGREHGVVRVEPGAG